MFENGIAQFASVQAASPIAAKRLPGVLDVRRTLRLLYACAVAPRAGDLHPGLLPRILMNPAELMHPNRNFRLSAVIPNLDNHGRSAGGALRNRKAHLVWSKNQAARE